MPIPREREEPWLHPGTLVFLDVRESSARLALGRLKDVAETLRPCSLRPRGRLLSNLKLSHLVVQFEVMLKNLRFVLQL